MEHINPVKIGLLWKTNNMSYNPPSFTDLMVAWNNNPFGTLWNKLINRLDSQRIIFSPDFKEQFVGNHRMVGLNPIRNQSTSSGWNGTVTFMRTRNELGPVVPSGNPDTCIDITYEGDGAGTVVYTNSVNLTNWPEHHIIMQVSALPSGTFPVW